MNLLDCGLVSHSEEVGEDVFEKGKCSYNFSYIMIIFSAGVSSPCPLMSW